MITQEEDKVLDRSMLFYYLKRWVETNTETSEKPEDIISWFDCHGKGELSQLIERALNEVMEDKK